MQSELPEEKEAPRSTPGGPSGYVRYAQTVGVVALATAVCFVMHGRFEFTNLVMVYLLAVALVASRFGWRESVLSSVLSIAVFDFVFVPPSWTFEVEDAGYIPTFVVMLVVGLLISTLTQRLHRQAQAASERERRTAALYALSKGMAQSRSKREIAHAAAREIRDVFDADVAVLLRRGETLEVAAASARGFEATADEAAAADWTLRHNEPAGRDSGTHVTARGLYLPLRGSTGAVGVLAVLPGGGGWPMPPAQRNLLETFANGLGLAIERTILAKESHEARLLAESERVRNALLSSISHDLRTPLTAIAGAASALREGTGDTSDLADTIVHESIRLNLQVQNLLDMTRLQSGQIALRWEWHSLEEIVGTALGRTSELLAPRAVAVALPPDLPLLRVDGDLLEKVFVNLLENAAAHTPTETQVEITASLPPGAVRVVVADTGPGIPPGGETRVFERFAQPQEGSRGRGFGLGLAICHAIIHLHGGRIWAENRPEGGAAFTVELPRPAEQPEVPLG